MMLLRWEERRQGKRREGQGRKREGRVGGRSERLTDEVLEEPRDLVELE